MDYSFSFNANFHYLVFSKILPGLEFKPLIILGGFGGGGGGGKES